MAGGRDIKGEDIFSIPLTPVSSRGQAPTLSHKGEREPKVILHKLQGIIKLKPANKCEENPLIFC
jgi:hypothetical protein